MSEQQRSRARIESLRVRAVGLGAEQATELAHAIGRGLSARSLELRPAAGGSLRVQVPGGLGSTEALANEAVARVLRALNGSGEEG